MREGARGRRGGKNASGREGENARDEHERRKNL